MSRLRSWVVAAGYQLSRLVPRDPRLFVCIGWHKTANGEVFADNAKYFFLDLQTHPSVRAIWLAKSRALATELQAAGLPAIYMWSLRGIWAALRANFYVIDAFLQDSNYALSGRAQIIQLLHGKGMKKKGYSEPQLRPQNHIFVPSPFTLEILPASFQVGAETHITGYSRNDQFFRSVPRAELSVDHQMHIHLQNTKAEGRPTILYAPTFRRGEKTFRLQGVELDTLEAWAKKQNVHVLLSLHNKYRAQQTQGHIGRHLSYLQESDIYPLFPLIDILVTDYSSSFTDFLLLDRPIVFYPYDLERYKETEGLAADYETITPGPKVKTFEELLDCLETTLATQGNDWRTERARVRDLYHTHQDGNASERIWAILNERYRLS